MNFNIIKICIYLLIIIIFFLVYWLIVILNKKKASNQKQVEQLGFLKQGKKYES
jgi:preprotein translocase subunit YajC